VALAVVLHLVFLPPPPVQLVKVISVVPVLLGAAGAAGPVVLGSQEVLTLGVMVELV
jgi:hypothetical protein